MQNTFFIKIYFLFLFVFIFTLSMGKFFIVDFLHLISIIFGVLILPLKHIFSNYFQKISFQKKILIFSLFLPFCYLFSFSYISFLFLIIYSFFIVFNLDFESFTIFGIFSFFCFFILYLLGFDIDLYKYFYIFSFYSFFISIFCYLLSNFNIKNNFLKNKVIIYLFIYLLLISFLFSLYFNNIINLIFYLLFLGLFIFGYIDKLRSIFLFNENQENIVIFSLFFIIFIPLINDLLILEQKNIILFLTFFSFSLLFVGFSFIFKIIKK